MYKRQGLNDSVALVESVTKDTLAVLPAPDGSFRYKGRYDEPTAAALVRKNGQTAAVLYIEPYSLNQWYIAHGQASGSLRNV